MKEKIVIVIPSLEPDNRLIDYVDSLIMGGFYKIIVVNDGSSSFYDEIYNKIAEKAIVLKHDINKGKGRAMKTAFTFIKENIKDAFAVITADSDGQHAVEDCLKLAELMESNKHALYLGTRDFNLPDIPLRSRFGNKTTTLVFKLLFGRYLGDTQTGLRGFLTQDLDFMLNIKGERYEYEMQMLIECVKKNIEYVEMPIRVIYENNNEGSHFNTFKDSWRIYKLMLSNLFSYLVSSIGCTCIDWIIFDILSYLVLPIFLNDQALLIWLSGVLARIFSSILNYLINRKYVFASLSKTSAIKYFILAITILIISNTFVTYFESIGLAKWLFKPITDVILAIISYRLQMNWVFK